MENDAFWIGDPFVDDTLPHRGDVLELRQTRIARQRIAPSPSVARRAAVVDLDNGKAVIDPRLHGRRVRIAVVRLRAPVDEEDRGSRALARGRFRDEGMNIANPNIRVLDADRSWIA